MDIPHRRECIRKARYRQQRRNLFHHVLLCPSMSSVDVVVTTCLPQFGARSHFFFSWRLSTRWSRPPAGGQGRGVTVGPGATLRDGRESRIRGWHKCPGMPLHAACLHTRGHEGSLCGQLLAAWGDGGDETHRHTARRPTQAVLSRGDDLAPRGAVRRCVNVCVRARSRCSPEGAEGSMTILFCTLHLALSDCSVMTQLVFTGAQRAQPLHAQPRAVAERSRPRVPATSAGGQH